MVKQSVAFIMLTIFTSLACAHYYEVRERGWFWYEVEETPEEEIKTKAQPERITLDNALEKRDEIRRQVEAAQTLAVLEPTQENILNYIQLQNEISERSAYFTKQWQRAVWQNPQLDYSIKNPTTHYARHTYYDELNQKAENILQAFGKKQGLFFFFRSDCPYCHRFAPVLKAFSEKYNITIVPISLDGGVLQEFPQAKRDNGAAQRLNVTTVPAVFSVNPSTQAIAPIGFGVLSAQELAQRIQALSEPEREAHDG